MVYTFIFTIKCILLWKGIHFSSIIYRLSIFDNGLYRDIKYLFLKTRNNRLLRSSNSSIFESFLLNSKSNPIISTPPYRRPPSRVTFLELCWELMIAGLAISVFGADYWKESGNSDDCYQFYPCFIWLIPFRILKS